MEKQEHGNNLERSSHSQRFHKGGFVKLVMKEAAREKRGGCPTQQRHQKQLAFRDAPSLLFRLQLVPCKERKFDDIDGHEITQTQSSEQHPRHFFFFAYM